MKPKVSCPHCQEHAEAADLAKCRIKRNSFGIDVFACPSCKKPMKFEPTEYLFARQQLESGESPQGIAIEGAAESDVLPSEAEAIDASFGGGKAKSKISLIIGWLVVAAILYAIFL